MGWAVGYDSNWGRDIGYGVPSWCDHPGCDLKIDRGLSYVCGSDPYGGDEGCGLYFCSSHLYYKDSEVDQSRSIQVCEACRDEVSPFEPKPDHPEWVHWKLTDDSWQKWRDENAELVSELTRVLEQYAGERCQDCGAPLDIDNVWEPGTCRDCAKKLSPEELHRG